MELLLLGAVEVWARGAQLKLPSTKLKQLLAALAWDAGRMVPTDTLVRRLWGEQAPPRELASVHANVSRLRAVLKQCGEPGAQLERVPLGYRLRLPAESIDLVQFRREQTRARAAAELGRIDEAIRLLRSAQSLVRGEPLAGLPGDWAAQIRAELLEQAHDVTLLRIELQLTAHPESARDLLTELTHSAAEHEFDQSVLELRMRALHLAGRTTEALHLYGEFRTRLREHSGLDPGPTSQRLYQQLLHNDFVAEAASGPSSAIPVVPPPVPTPVRPSATVPDTLDRDPPGFVGRRADVAVLTAEVERRLAAGQTALLVIDGMPGIGKSTLALYVAHRLRRHCPDGALQLRLRGHDEHIGATSPETALDVLVGMLGATAKEVQRSQGLDHAIARWRRYVNGKRLLILLDDASSAEQVLPLIPTGPGSIVLVTARTRLTDLPGATRHALAPMSDTDAAELFSSTAQIAHGASDPALRGVLTACDGFPLALSLAGNTLRMRESWSVADLAVDLSARHVSGRPGSVIAPAIARTVATSYRDLPEIERRILRRLALDPGPRIPVHAVAALADAAYAETNQALFQLVSKNLIFEPSRHHYRLHDMMRLFAEDACAADESAQELELAAERLALYTIGAVESATRLFHPHRHVRLAGHAADTDGSGDDSGNDSGGSSSGSDESEAGFRSAAEAAAWLDSEREWLMATASSWFARDRALHAATLCHMLAKYLDRRSLWKQGIDLHRRSLEVWRELGNAGGQAHALTDLAAAYWRIGSGDLTLLHAQAALEIWSALDDTEGQADALLQLARAYVSQRRYGEAIASAERCAALRIAAQDTRGHAVAMHHLGTALFESGRHGLAISRVLVALDLAREIGDENIQLACINNLGEFHNRIGDFAGAASCYRQALPLAQKFSDGYNLGVVVVNLGDAQTRLGRPAAALPLLERAMQIFQAVESEHGRLLVLTAQARAHQALGRGSSARTLLEQAYELAERLVEPRQISSICLIHGDTYAAEDDSRAARKAYEQALIYAGQADSPLLEAVACHRLGDNCAASGDLRRARTYWRRALALYGDDGYTEQAAALRSRLETDEAA